MIKLFILSLILISGGVFASDRFHVSIDSRRDCEVRHERVLVCEGYYQRVWIEPIYETHCDRFGRHHTHLIRPGRYESVWVPARYEYRPVYIYHRKPSFGFNFSFGR